jgi:hypothetical protein
LRARACLLIDSSGVTLIEAYVPRKG